MEHPCYKCQTSIDETLPFCPHCGAPQIRVASPEEGTQPPPLTPDAQQVRPPTSWAPAPAYHPQAVHWDAAWKGTVLCGLIAAVLTAVPGISMGCCLWLLGAGALSVFLYQRRLPAAFVTPGMGMRIGAVSGVVGFVASTFWLVLQFAKNSQEFRTALEEQMEKSIGTNPDPRAQDLLRQFMNTLNTPQGLATFFVLILVVMAIAFVVFTAAGGALGAAMYARRRDVR
ncbi:MAG TPA: hypothetical protein VF783_10550 [Terriglobales bacterium]